MENVNEIKMKKTKKMKKNKLNKGINRIANITIQTVFFIMMSLFMVAIIVFGIQKMFLIGDTLSDNDRIQLKQEIKQAVDFCNDPLNRGSFKRIKVDSNKYNMVCFKGTNHLDTTKYGSYLSGIVNTDDGRNTYLVKADFDGTNYINVNVVDSFNSSMKKIAQSYCMYKNIKITC